MSVRCEKDGWCYDDDPPSEGDCRKIVTLEEDGMVWVGIRAFNHSDKTWMNNNDRERTTIKAWRDLPSPASGFYDAGLICIPNDDLMRPMGSPTLPEGNPLDD